MIGYRNHRSIPNFVLVDKDSFFNYLEFFKTFPFVIITCLPKDLDFVREVEAEFEFKPIVACFSSSVDVVLDEKFNIFSFDDLLLKRFSEIKELPFFQGHLEQITNPTENLRKSCLIDKGLVSRSHGVTQVSEQVLFSLGYVFGAKEHIKPIRGREEYIEAILNSADILFEETKAKKAGGKSDLIVYSPSIAAHFYKFNSNFWNQLKRKIKEKDYREFVFNGLFKNPDYSGFLMNTDPKKNPYEHPHVMPLLVIRQSELALTAIAVGFLAVSNNCPAVRLPNSVNFHLAKLKDIESLVSSASKHKLKRKFKELVGAMRDEIGPELIDYVNEKSTSITLCTDSIIEWVTFNRIPLMFTHEISKIHTTSGNQLLKLASQSINIAFSKEELLSVTVIRSFHDNDPVKDTLEEGINYFINIDKKVTVEFIDVGNKLQFSEALDMVTSPILIIDCHGDHGGSESNGWLKIGKDQVDISELEFKVVPSIIILSACLTSAISGSHASVANALLNSGAMSVIGTLLHVDALKSSVFVGRILYRLTGYLDVMAKLGMGELTWRQFIAGFFRMSFCSDICTSFLEKGALTEDECSEIHINASYDINTNDPLWFDNLVKSISSKSKIEIENIYDEISGIGLTETMHYSQIGCPENIKIILD